MDQFIESKFATVVFWLDGYSCIHEFSSRRKKVHLWRPMLKTLSRSGSHRSALLHTSTRSSSRRLQVFLCYLLLKLCPLRVSLLKFPYYAFLTQTSPFLQVQLRRPIQHHTLRDTLHQAQLRSVLTQVFLRLPGFYELPSPNLENLVLTLASLSLQECCRPCLPLPPFRRRTPRSSSRSSYRRHSSEAHHGVLVVLS